MDRSLPADVRNVLTVDVEEYFQVEAFSGLIKKEDWEKYPKRVEGQVHRLLDLLAAYERKGTFFVLGWLAERHPALIRKIHREGHEIASHGYEHTMITQLSPRAFRRDIRRSKIVLERVTGSEVQGYRAPTFSIVESTAWAYGILLDEGFRYSSSVFPIRHDRYGWPGFGVTPRIMAGNKETAIWEIPMSAGELGPVRIPFAGGGYLRAYPLFLTKWFWNRYVRKNGQPVILYVHPWELDGHQPSINVPFLRRVRHSYGIPSVWRKLEHLIRLLTFDTMASRVNDLKTESCGAFAGK